MKTYLSTLLLNESSVQSTYPPDFSTIDAPSAKSVGATEGMPSGI